MTGHTPARPSQLTLRSMPWRMPKRTSAITNSSRAASSASAQRGSSSKCQQTITPESTSSRSTSGSSSVPRRGVLAGHARRDAVEVVAPADHREDDRRQRVGAVVGGEREHEEDRDQREPDVADRVRDRPRVQRLAGERLRRRRAGAVEAREPAEGQPRALYGRLATGPPPPPRRPPAARCAARARAAPAPRARRPRACAARPSAAAARRAARRRRTSPGPASRSS